MHATLHKSELVPHFAPKMTSGQRYCRVCISSVKWCSIHVAWVRKRLKELDEDHMELCLPFPRSAILTVIFDVSS